MLLLFVYAALSVAGVYVDYLAGLYVERAYGGHISLIFFMFAFFAVLVCMFPLALRITRPANRE
ncbi:hypothetical protein JNW90_26125 [Micromonospora sp. STR1s_5]|nr:hypothetical protein [Micromonospora sp. STR1s_5]